MHFIRNDLSEGDITPDMTY